MKNITIRWKSYPHYLPKIRLRRRHSSKFDLSVIPTTDGAGSSKVSKSYTLKPVTDIPVYWRAENDQQHLNSSSPAEHQAQTPTIDSTFDHNANSGSLVRNSERVYDIRIAPKSGTLVRSAKSVTTQLGPFKPNVNIYRDGQVGKRSVQKNRQSLRTISRYSSHSRNRRSAAPSIQSVVRSVLSNASSRSPSQRKALAQFTKDLARYSNRTKQLPNLPRRGLIESPSATSISATTIKELEPYRAQFVSAGLAITSTEQQGKAKTRNRFIRVLDGRRDTQYEQIAVSRPKTYAVPVIGGGKRVKSVLKKRKPSFASGSTGTTVIGFTPPHEKSMPRIHRPRKASTLSSDHTVVRFSSPHQKVIGRSFSPPSHLPIVRSSRQQENYLPATSSEEKLSPNQFLPASDQALVIARSSPATNSSPALPQRRDRLVMAPIVQGSVALEDNYSSPTVSVESSNTIVVRRTQEQLVQRKQYFQPSATHKSIIQTPSSQDRGVQQPDHLISNLLLRGRSKIVGVAQPNICNTQRVVTPANDELKPSLLPHTVVSRISTARAGEDVEENPRAQASLDTATSAGEVEYDNPQSPTIQASKQGNARIEYDFDDQPLQSKLALKPKTLLDDTYNAAGHHPPQELAEAGAPLPTVGDTFAEIPASQEMAMPKQFSPSDVAPSVDAQSIRDRYAREQPTTYAGSYYYIKDPGEQQRLVLVPAHFPGSDSSFEFSRSTRTIIQAQAPDVSLSINSSPPQGPHIQKPAFSPVYPGSPKKHLQQSRTFPDDYAIVSPNGVRDLLVQAMTSSPNSDTATIDKSPRGNAKLSPPRIATKESLPWLRKSPVTEAQSRIRRKEMPLPVSGTSPLFEDPKDSNSPGTARVSHAEVKLSDNAPLDSNNSGNKLEPSPHSEGDRGTRISRHQSQLQRERDRIDVESNDRVEAIISKFDPERSRFPHHLKALAVVQEDRLQIERNRRVTPRDANDTDGLLKFSPLISSQTDAILTSARKISPRSRMKWAQEDAMISTNGELSLVMNSDAPKLLPFVQQPAILRKSRARGKSIQPPAVAADEAQNDERNVDQKASHVLPTVRKRVQVKEGQVLVNSMKGIVLEESQEILGKASGLNGVQVSQKLGDDILHQAPANWSSVNWTKRPDLDEAEMLIRNMPINSNSSVDKVFPFIEKTPSIKERWNTDATERDEKIEENSPPMSSGRPLVHNQLEIPPRNPKNRFQVRWLGDRNILPELSVSTAPAPFSPPSTPRMQQRTQTKGPQSIVYADRWTQYEVLPRVEVEAAISRARSGNHGCSSGSFHCEQCYPYEFQLPDVSPKTIPLISSRKVHEHWDGVTIDAESHLTAEDGEEFVQRPVAKANIVEVARLSPVSDLMKRSSVSLVINKVPLVTQSSNLQEVLDTVLPVEASPKQPRLQQPQLQNINVPFVANLEITSQPDCATTAPNPTQPRTPSYNAKVLQGLHVATAAASDEDVDAWIGGTTGVSVRRFLVELSVLERAGIDSLVNIARRVK